VLNSTISGNSVGSGNIGQGGGIYNLGGTATVINSTVSGNSALSGGGITSQGTLTVINSTVSGNSALSGGGILNFVTLTVSNSIVAGNTTDIPDGAEIYSSTPFTSGGYNLFGDSSKTTAQALFNVTTLSSDILATSDSLTPTALASILAPLANNGGPTQTHALVAGSLAINRGSNALIPAGVTTDQRGFFTRTVGDTVDIGAFEFGAVLPPPNSPPVARNDSFTTNEDTLIVGNVIVNTNPNESDSDADDNPLTIATVNSSATNVGTTISLTRGSLKLNADGSFTYTPNTNDNGSDSFTYTLSDGTTTSNTATVSFTINPVNDDPVVSAIADQTTFQNTATDPINFTISDVETAASALTVTATSSNTTLIPNGNITFGGSGTNRTLIVTPATNQFGTATITVNVSDSSITTPTTFTINVGRNLNGGNGIDILNGTAGRDRIDGGNGDDILFGDAGNDILFGGNGNDRLRGGLGNDTLTGGLGVDTFILAAGEGSDLVQDFQNGTDKLGLAGGLTFNQLTFQQDGTRTRIKIAATGEELAVLANVTVNQLDLTDFVTV
jgi:VCBS repeat-containing protein